jgi:hypothetical protein
MEILDDPMMDYRTEERIQVIVDLSRRRDHILEDPEMNLEALAILAADYEAANMTCAAANLRRRLEYYRERQEYLELVQIDLKKTEIIVHRLPTK